MSPPLRQLDDRAGSVVVRVQSELEKDDAVLDNGSQGSQKPGERLQQVVLVLRIGDEARAVRQVAGHREHEEKKRKTFTRLLSVVLDDLRDSGAVIC